MNRQYTPTSRPLRSIFFACALALTVAVAAFIDLLATDRGAVDVYTARPAGVIARQS